MEQSKSKNVVSTLVVSAIIFLAASLPPKLLISLSSVSIAVVQSVELGLSLLAIVFLGKRRFADYGFRLPANIESDNTVRRHWAWMLLLAFILGAAASIAILGGGGTGNPAIKKLSPFQIILFVWAFSSVIEEVFTRGFLQSHLTSLKDSFFSIGRFRLS